MCSRYTQRPNQSFQSSNLSIFQSSNRSSRQVLLFLFCCFQVNLQIFQSSNFSIFKSSNFSNPPGYTLETQSLRLYRRHTASLLLFHQHVNEHLCQSSSFRVAPGGLPALLAQRDQQRQKLSAVSTQLTALLSSKSSILNSFSKPFQSTYYLLLTT